MVPTTSHYMVTPSHVRIYVPKKPFNLTASAISPVPSSVRAAIHDLNWFTTMQSKYSALISNGTWTLILKPQGAHIVSGKWVFKQKFNPGSLDKHKSGWVVRGFSQCSGIDFLETFTPIVKSATIRTVLMLNALCRWPVKQLDVSNAFLHGQLQENVFCQQPVGFVDPQHPDAVCLLPKSLYGLKQAPRAWFTRFEAFITKSMGFIATRSDPSLFVLQQEH
jgi:hypothetical protein